MEMTAPQCVSKGQLIDVEGRLQTGQWDDDAGVRHQITQPPSSARYSGSEAWHSFCFAGFEAYDGRTKLDRTRYRAMGRRLVVLWALIALPFWVTAMTGGPDGLLPHAVFHPVYFMFLIGAILVLLRLRSATGSRVVRGVAIALIVAQAAAISGTVGEEIAVLQHGGLSAGREVFEEPLHMLSAWLTLPGVLLSQILLILLTIAAVLAMRSAQRLAASPRGV
jgi:hypothetical protein